METDKFYKLPQGLTSRKDLFASDKIVYAVILDFIGNNGKCWPSKRVLSERTGLSGQTIISAIKRLEPTGLLTVEHRGNGKSNHYKIGQAVRPVKPLDRSNDDTTGGQAVRPEAVKPLDPNQTDLLNQRGREPTPEEKAKINFQAAIAESNLPTDFLTWFERELFARWNKLEISPAILSDWHSLYADYGADILTQAVQRHRQETPRRDWNPDLSAVKKMAGKIRAERRKQQQSQKPRQQEPTELAPAVWEGDAKEVADKCKKNPLLMELVQKHRPDVVKIL